MAGTNAVSHDPAVIDPSLKRARSQMLFPPELVDEILTHLRRDKQALRNRSLVTKSWTYPCQKLIYTPVRITPSTHQTRQEIVATRPFIDLLPLQFPPRLPRGLP